MSANGEKPGHGLVPAILSALTVPHREGAHGSGRDGQGQGQEHGQKHGPKYDGVGHETEDVDVRNTAFVMAGLMGSALVAIGVMVWLIHTVSADQKASLPRLTPQQTARLAPPPPNLQANPFADIDRERQAQAERLDGYAYLDGQRTRARIPLDRAMTLTVGRPLDP